MKTNSLKISLLLSLQATLAEAFSPSGKKIITGTQPVKGLNEEHKVVPLQSDNLFDQDYGGIQSGSFSPKAKTSLDIMKQSHTAKPWILTLVAYSHWASLLPAFMASYAVYDNSSVWFEFLGNDNLRVMLWMLAPLITFASALPPITMHAYEDWQIAPPRDPVEETFRFQDYNNDRLRAVSLTMLFQMVTASNFAMSFGYFGTSAILPYALLAAVTSMLKEPTNAFLPKNFPDRNLVAPMQVGSTVLMAMSTLVAIAIQSDLAGHHIPGGNAFLKIGALMAIPLIGLGGVYEGFVGETKFNQWDHAIANVAVFTGFLLWAWTLFEIGHTGLIM